MAYNEKIIRLGQSIVDTLTYAGFAVAQAYDSSSNLYLTITDTSLNGSNSVVKLEKIAQIANNLSNPVTGLTEDVFTPHIIKVGFGVKTPATGQAALSSVTGGVQATGTATASGVVATNTVVVNGVTFTATAGAPGANQFQVGGTDGVTAANLAAAINASASAGVQDIFAAQDGTIAAKVNLRAKTPGTSGNAYTIADGGSGHFTVSGATLASGANGDWLSVSGVKFYALAAGQVQFANQWFVGASDVTATAALISAINGSSTAGITGVVSASLYSGDATSKTALISAVTGGAIGNTVTLSSSGAHITVTGATLTGGSDAGTVSTLRYQVLAAAARLGPQVEVYEKSASIAVTDLVTANQVLTIRNQYWGNVAHV